MEENSHLRRFPRLGGIPSQLVPHLIGRSSPWSGSLLFRNGCSYSGRVPPVNIFYKNILLISLCVSMPLRTYMQMVNLARKLQHTRQVNA